MKNMTEKVFASEVPGCPPSTLEEDQLLCYYRLLGSLESFYFELCEEDFNKHERRQWTVLNNRLSALEHQVSDFNSRLQSDHLCIEVLKRNSVISRRLLWLDEESEEACGDYLKEEGSAIDGYNENNWFGEPYFWEDQIGGVLNELATIILGNSPRGARGAIRETVDSIDFYNQKRIAHLDSWLEFLARHIALHDVDQLHKTIESSAELASAFLSDFYTRDSLTPMAVCLFADRRNTNCLAYGRTLMNLETGVTYSEIADC